MSSAWLTLEDSLDSYVLLSAPMTVADDEGTGTPREWSKILPTERTSSSISSSPSSAAKATDPVPALSSPSQSVRGRSCSDGTSPRLVKYFEELMEVSRLTVLTNELHEMQPSHRGVCLESIAAIAER